MNNEKENPFEPIESENWNDVKYTIKMIGIALIIAVIIQWIWF